MKKYLIIFLLLSYSVFGQSSGRGGVASNVEEADGSPSTYPYKIIFPNGCLIDNGDGTVSYAGETDPIAKAINGIIKSDGTTISAAISGTDYAPALGADDNYVTDAEKVIIGNTSGTNTGDNSANSTYANDYRPGGTDVAVADGGTGASTAQAAIDTLTAVSAATNEYVLTKDTVTGNAIFKVAQGGDLVNDTSPQLGGDLDLNGKNIDFPTTANISDCLDDRTMTEGSAVKLTTQGSIKNFVLDTFYYNSQFDAGTTVAALSNPTEGVQLANGNILVCGHTTNKVYKSTDNGATWDAGTLVAAGLFIQGITQLANGWVLVSGTNAKVYKSTDNGATWDAGTTVAALAQLYSIRQLSNGNVLVVAYNQDKVYTSTDNGATWDAGVLIAAGAGTTGIVQLSNGNVLATGITTNKVYTSTDNGATWDAGVLIATGAGIYGINKLSNGWVLASGYTLDKIYKSIDNGATWDVGKPVVIGAGIIGITQLTNGWILVFGNTTHKVYKHLSTLQETNATTTSKGVASFDSTDFNVTAGNVTRKNTGYIKGFLVTYKDANEIYYSDGEIDVNGTLVKNTTASTAFELTTTVTTDFYYLYINNAGTVTYSNTEPAWSATLHGWYNGTIRCFGRVWTTGINTIEFFTAQDLGKNIFIQKSITIQIASNMNPSYSWQIPDDNESSVYVSKMANHVYLQGYGADADSTFAVYVTNYELATANATVPYNASGSTLHSTSGDVGCPDTMFLCPLEASRNIRLTGIDDDDNNLSMWVRGEIYSR